MKNIYKILLAVLCFCTFTNKAMGTNPTVVSAISLNSTSVIVVFSNEIDPASVAANGYQFTFTGGLTATAAFVSDHMVAVTTQYQDAKNYTVNVNNTVKNTNGENLVAPFEANFIGFDPPVFSGNGTSGSPYLITTAAQLAQLATYVNEGNTTYNAAYYRLENDLDLTIYGKVFNGGKGWIPIGTKTNPFKGNFNGNEKIISNLLINNTTTQYVGLFGYIDGGTVKNLGIENANITSLNLSMAAFTGILTGYCYVGNILNCYTTGSLSSTSSSSVYAGGIASAISNYNASGFSISNCYSTASISASTSSASSYVNAGGIVGGILGYSINNSTISNCYSTSYISFSASESNCARAGGLVGHQGQTLSDCAALNPAMNNTGIVSSSVGRIRGGSSEGLVLSNNIAFDNMLNPSGTTTWSNKGLDQRDGADISKEEINAGGTFGGRFTAANGWTTQKGKLPGLFGKTVEMPAHLLLVPVTNIKDVPATATMGVPLALTGTVEPSNATNKTIVWSVVNAGTTGADIISGTLFTTSVGTATIKATITNGLFTEDYVQGFSINVTDGTGIDDVFANQLNIYPNPTNGLFIIDASTVSATNGDLKIENIEIFDITGQNVGENLRICPDNTGKIKIDISHLPTGIYFVRTNGKIVKIIKN